MKKTIKIAIIEQHTHEVELELPAYFHAKSGRDENYYKIWDWHGTERMDVLTFTNGTPERYLKRYPLSQEATAGEIITEREYRFKLMDLITDLEIEAGVTDPPADADDPDTCSGLPSERFEWDEKRNEG